LLLNFSIKNTVSPLDISELLQTSLYTLVVEHGKNQENNTQNMEESPKHLLNIYVVELGIVSK
jgi:hypothetical protein